MKKLQTPHEVLWELSSPAIHCSSLASDCETLTVGTAVPHHLAGGRERVCTMNTVTVIVIEHSYSNFQYLQCEYS